MTTPSHTDELAAEHFARKLTAHLTQGDEHLPYVVTERLRAARMQALAQRKRAPLGVRAVQMAPANVVMGQFNGTAVLGGSAPSHDNTPLWVRRLLTALPLVGLACALAFIGADHDSRITVDVADVDAALLTNELPPAVFTDPGFQQYLQLTVSDTP